MNSKAQVKRKLRHVVRFVVNVALNRLNFRTAAGNRAWAIISYVQHRILSYRSIFFPNILRFWTFFYFFPSATNEKLLMSDDSLCQKQSGPFLIVVFLLVLFQLRVQSTDTIDGLIYCLFV